MPLQDYGRYMMGSAEMAAAPANALLGAYDNAQQNARRNALTDIAQQRTDIQWQQAQQDRASQLQGQQAEQQKAAEIEQARAILAAGRSGNPAARAYALKFVISKAPPEVQAGMAQADPEQLWSSIEPALAQAVGEKPQPGQLYQTAEGFLPAEQAVGKMPYQAPQRAPIEGPTSAQRDFQFYSSLTPKQQELYDKVNGRGGGGAGGVTVGPDGQLMVNPDPAKATEGERTSANYLSRMSRAEMLLGDYVPSFTDYASARSVMQGGPATATVANNILSPQGQQYYQAAADWVRAKLRKESGAVISPQEMEQEIKTYFPLPGDDPKTIAQKRAARIQAQEGMKMMGGRAVIPSEAPKQATESRRVNFEDLP